MSMKLIILIGIGLLLIVLELIFVPGTTVVGIVGLICLAVGVYLSFQFFGVRIGWTVLVGSSVTGFGILIYTLRSRAWERFTLKRSIDSKVNEEFPLNLQVGEVGEAISALRPMGNADFNSRIVEVRSHGNYVKTGRKVQIVKIDNNIVLVEPYKS